MRALQLEAWVLDIVADLDNGKVPEDSRVELKATWPVDSFKAARRLAGHANAALDDSILWIIGLDEREGVIGIDSVNTAQWLDEVGSLFDGLIPTSTDLIVRIGDKCVVALLFDTTRAPFVVTNPQFGKTTTPISHEVPWREGTKVRSARREDLIRILGNTIARPDVEVLDAKVQYHPADNHENQNLFLTCDVYIVPRDESILVIPFHRSYMQLRDAELQVEIQEAHAASRYLRLPGFGAERGPVSHTVYTADNEVICQGPGRVSFVSRHRMDEPPEWHEVLVLDISLAVAGSAVPIKLSQRLRRMPRDDRGDLVWAADESPTT